MYVMDEVIKKRDEDVEAIINVLKNNEGLISAKTIAESAGLPIRRVYDLMSDYIMPDYPEVNSIPGPKGGYSWVETKTELDPVVRKKEITRNAEGYPDPTAAAVLEKLERNGKDRAGEIWSTNNEECYFLVLASFRGLVIGMNVCTMDAWYDPEYDQKVNIRGKSYYMNLRRIVSKPAKTLVANFGNVGPERLGFIRSAVAKLLGLQTEKLVEVRKPYPVEVEKLVYRTRTKFDRKKLRRVVPKAVDVSKYQQLVNNARNDREFYKNQVIIANVRADAWEEAFRLMALGKTHD